MPNHKLGATSKQEIRDALRGLTGAKAAAEIERLAKFYGCSESQIYILSREVRPLRKARADRGRRVADLLTDESLLYTTARVLADNLLPADAIETAELNGKPLPVTLATLRRYLREHGLNRRMRRRNARAYRAWEADAPMNIFQFDISGVKQRWVDLNTRRIYQVSVLDESRNHPYEHPSRVRLWKFCLIDDHSRRKFVRFVACDKPNSMHCIEFMLEAFRVMGIPRMFYTDRDAIIVGERTTRAAQILNRLYEEDGGFRMQQHRAGNPQATGKVERMHQVVEQHEPFIGMFERGCLALGERGATLSNLNKFADEMCDKVNWSECRAINNEIPMLRWKSHQPLRLPPPAVLDSVFSADEFIVPVAGDVTISFGGARYQLPRTKDFPFREYAEAGSKIKIVLMKDALSFFVADAAGEFWEIDKMEARPDAAGDYKSLPEAKRERAHKAVEAYVAEESRLHKEAGTRNLVPGFDGPFKRGARPTPMPQQRIEADTSRLTEIAPAAAAFVEGRLLDRWQAITQFQQEDYFRSPISAADKAWLLALYGDHEALLDTKIRAALDARPATRRSA